MLKKLTILLIFSLLFSSCFYEANIPDNISQKTPVKIEKNLNKENKQEVSNLKNVWVEEFKKELEKGDSILIDLRTPEELKQGIIPWVKLNLDYYSKDFINKLKALDKNKKYLIYCHSWHRSWNTLLLMKKFWFKNVFNLENWIISWVNSWEKLGSFKEKNK